MSAAPAEIDIHRLPDFVGQDFTSGWVEMTQDRITQFAETTEDRQWIHIDAERASRESPYGTTIAHGFLTLSLVSHLMRDAVRIVGGRMNINYGLNKVRFPSPVPAGARVRARFTLAQVERIGDAQQATWSVVVEREGSEKPCCAAEWLVRSYA